MLLKQLRYARRFRLVEDGPIYTLLLDPCASTKAKTAICLRGRFGVARIKFEEVIIPMVEEEPSDQEVLEDDHLGPGEMLIF